MLEHERVHVARKDYLVKLLFWGAVCLHWFNPLVWLAFFLMENDMEMSCDEAVLRRLGGEAKRGYSQALLSLSSEGAGMIGNPVSFGEGVVKKRICNILGWRRSRMVTLICLSVLLGGLAAGLALNPADQKEAEENLRLGFVSAYANAYCDRDGDTLVGMYVDEETAFENVLLLDRVGGTYSFGLSSPWPNEFRFRLSEEGQAEIWYYAWTSDPHVVVWKEEMRFDPGKRRVTGSEIHYLDRISSQAEFEEAYLIGGEYQFTDYVERGFADSIQTQTVSDRENGEEDRNVVYRSPDTAAEWILNLDGGKGEVISDSPNGRATVRYTFGDGSSVEIPMYNAGGDAAADDTGETEDGSLAGMALWLLDLQAWKA